MATKEREWGKPLDRKVMVDWLDDGGSRAAIMEATGKGKSTVSAWYRGEFAPPPEDQERIHDLIRGNVVRKAAAARSRKGAPRKPAASGSVPLEEQRRAMREAGVLGDLASMGQDELRKRLEAALDDLRRLREQVQEHGTVLAGQAVTIPFTITLKVGQPVHGAP